ncbi:MAG: YbhB/YbcL family Raf kinase inhibitor-like protein [Methanomassiliicoccus sp.]|nr:YbhB/YbcL family Raf kinase inhibitor-like protein [Methanomassiliicoccus sp.]
MSDRDLKVELGFNIYPSRYTCDGEGISPSITISGLTAPYLAMIMDDPDARGTFTHWIIWNIPARDRIPESVSPVDHPPELPGATQGLNSGQEIGYTPPCPPRGSHRYVLKVYGLNAQLDLGPGASKRELETKMEAKIVQFGEAMATYARP